MSTEDALDSQLSRVLVLVRLDHRNNALVERAAQEGLVANNVCIEAVEGRVLGELSLLWLVELGSDEVREDVEKDVDVLVSKGVALQLVLLLHLEVHRVHLSHTTSSYVVGWSRQIIHHHVHVQRLGLIWLLGGGMRL